MFNRVFSAVALFGMQHAAISKTQPHRTAGEVGAVGALGVSPIWTHLLHFKNTLERIQWKRALNQVTVSDKIC